MAAKLTITDERMLALMDWAVANDVAENNTQYLELIGFSRTNLGNVTRGFQSFTKDHILNACKITGANANWIFGLEANMMRKPASDVITNLKQAVIAIEKEFELVKKKKPVRVSQRAVHKTVHKAPRKTQKRALS